MRTSYHFILNCNPEVLADQLAKGLKELDQLIFCRINFGRQIVAATAVWMQTLH
jgi:hypothetical protein